MAAPTRTFRLLVIFLRIAGFMTLAAFPAMFLPVDFMASSHQWLGLGEFPRSAIVDYLARSIAALYGFHGVLVLLVSTDPIRYRPIVWYIAIMNIAFGAIMVAIDLHAGLPMYWTAFEGPPIAALGIVIAVLNARVRAEPASARGNMRPRSTAPQEPATTSSTRGG